MIGGVALLVQMPHPPYQCPIHTGRPVIFEFLIMFRLTKIEWLFRIPDIHLPVSHQHFLTSNPRPKYRNFIMNCQLNPQIEQYYLIDSFLYFLREKFKILVNKGWLETGHWLSADTTSFTRNIRLSCKLKTIV